MRYLALIAVVLLCAVSLESQISPGALHRLIGNPSAGGIADSPTNWASLKAWYRPDGMYDLTLTNLAAANTAVGRWKDQSGNNHDLVVSDEQPRYATNRTGGANGSNYISMLSDSSGFTPSPLTNNLELTNYTIVSLVKEIPRQGSAYPIFNTASNGYNILQFTKPNIITVGTSNGPATFTTNVWLNLTTTGAFNSSNGYVTNKQCYINSAYYTNNTENNEAFHWLGLGFVGGVRVGSTHYQEILVYNVVLTTNQITSAYNYLKDKYGL